MFCYLVRSVAYAQERLHCVMFTDAVKRCKAAGDGWPGAPANTAAPRIQRRPSEYVQRVGLCEIAAAQGRSLAPRNSARREHEHRAGELVNRCNCSQLVSRCSRHADQIPAL